MSTSQEKKLPSNRTYTVDDIAAILGIAKSTAYRLVNSGEFKTIRIGYAIRISRVSVNSSSDLSGKNASAKL